jgi:hypothetical protein
MKTIEDYQKEVLQAKDDTVQILKDYIAYVNGSKKEIQRLEEENELLKNRFERDDVIELLKAFSLKWTFLTSNELHTWIDENVKK